MNEISSIEPIDYLVIGHLTQDVVASGFTLGGTVSYAGLTAAALGLRVGIITSCAADLALPELVGITVISKDSAWSTTFENRYSDGQRTQTLLHRAEKLSPGDIPSQWLNTPIVHLGPVAQELDPALAAAFPHSFVGITPQGWLRTWDGHQRVFPCRWNNASEVLNHCSAAVLSLEDVQGEEDEIQEFSEQTPVLCVTEGARGSRVYWNRDLRTIRAPRRVELDATGAGDIYAASFFVRYAKTRDPWEATRFATLIAANSVTRMGLGGVPTADEIKSISTEIVNA
jgi:sugar/nucleoside kinase (ribokinase family)